MAIVVVTPRRQHAHLTACAFASCALVGALLPGANAVLLYAEQRRADRPHLTPDRLPCPLWSRDRIGSLCANTSCGGSLADVGVGFAGVAILARPSGSDDGARRLALASISALMWSAGSGRRRPAADAEPTPSPRRRGRCSLGGARAHAPERGSRPSATAFALGLLDSRLGLPRDVRLGRRLHRLHLAARERPARLGVHLRLRQPDRGAQPRRALPQRAHHRDRPRRRRDRRRGGRGRRTGPGAAGRDAA